jgi:hypothetical protein
VSFSDPASFASKLAEIKRRGSDVSAASTAPGDEVRARQQRALNRAGFIPRRVFLLGGGGSLRCDVLAGWRFGINRNGAAAFPRWTVFAR